MKNGISEGAKQGSLLGAFLLFFGMLWYAFPIGIYPDSGAYVSMQAGREPLYPVFLAFFRWIFREGDTLTWLAASGQLNSEKALGLMREWPALNTSMLMQSLLAACACFFLTMVIRRLFGLNWFLTAAVGLCTLIPYLLTPIASASHMVLNKAVLTEGLTFPFVYFFTGFMARGLLTEKGEGRSYLKALFMAALLILTRNQMLVFFAVWCAVMLFEALRRKNVRYALLACAGILLLLSVKSLANRAYNGYVHADYSGMSSASYNLLTTLLYLSEEEDAGRLSDPAQRELFLQMRRRMEEEGLARSNAPKGILNKAYHYEDCYDRIGFAIQQPCLFGYVEAQGIPNDRALDEALRLSSQMARELFPALLPAYVSNYLAGAASGFTRSIAASGGIMGVYSIILYLLAIGLVIYLYKRDPKSRAAYLMLLALLMICANVLGTALMIMCLSRYMIYNTSLFYIAGLMCLREGWKPWTIKN